jgi:hypothetical protein
MSTDWTRRTWLGLAGGGVSGSLVVGGSAYQINLWRMDGRNVPLRVLITGFRAGLVAQVEAGHMICILQNVTNPSDFSTIKSSGLDWSLGSGVDWDSVIKSGGKLSAELVKLAGKKTAQEMGSWAGQEATKKAVQGYMDDYDLKPKGQAFIMLPTPAALSAGAGLFYEWQTMRQLNGDKIAYEYIPPEWGFVGKGESLEMIMRNIPEQDGTRLCLQFANDTWGANETLHFSNNQSTSPTNATSKFWVTVKNGRAYTNGIEGIPLGKMSIIGDTPNTFVTMPKPEKSNYANKTFNMEMWIGKSDSVLARWKSDETFKVTTDSKARITSVGSKYWKD